MINHSPSEWLTVAAQSSICTRFQQFNLLTLAPYFFRMKVVCNQITKIPAKSAWVNLY